jgi:GT2 family glycosyltransferase
MISPLSVTVVIVSWNSAEYIVETIRSLTDQTFGPVNIVVVDSNSSDGTPELVSCTFPSVELIRCNTNVGYRDGNRMGMSVLPSDYTVVLNDDAYLAPNAIDVLVEYMEARPQVGLTTPMVLVHGQPDLLNTAGNRLTYLGLASCRGKWHSSRDFRQSGPVAAVGGCAFMIRRSVLEHIDGLSADFGQYASGCHGSIEDADLSLRAWIAGYAVHYVAEATATHRYTQRGMSVQRYAALDCGRHLLLLRNLERQTLLRLLPLLATLEVSMVVFAALRGPRYLAAKLDVLRWIVTHRSTIKEMRHAIQKVRRVKDKEILPYLDDEIEFAGALGGSGPVKVLEKLFGAALRVYGRVFLYRSPQELSVPAPIQNQAGARDYTH